MVNRITRDKAGDGRWVSLNSVAREALLMGLDQALGGFRHVLLALIPYLPTPRSDDAGGRERVHHEGKRQPAPGGSGDPHLIPGYGPYRGDEAQGDPGSVVQALVTQGLELPGHDIAALLLEPRYQGLCRGEVNREVLLQSPHDDVAHLRVRWLMVPPVVLSAVVHPVPPPLDLACLKTEFLDLLGDVPLRR
jgi:hypothetical protein